MLASQRNSLLVRGQAIGVTLNGATLRFTPSIVNVSAMRGNFNAQLDLALGGTTPDITIAFSIDRTLIPVGVVISEGKSKVLWVEANRTLRIVRVGGEGTPLVYLGCEDPNKQ